MVSPHSTSPFCNAFSLSFLESFPSPFAGGLCVCVFVISLPPPEYAVLTSSALVPPCHPAQQSFPPSSPSCVIVKKNNKKQRREGNNKKKDRKTAMSADRLPLADSAPLDSTSGVRGTSSSESEQQRWFLCRLLCDLTVQSTNLPTPFPQERPAIPLKFL